MFPNSGEPIELTMAARTTPKARRPMLVIRVMGGRVGANASSSNSNLHTTIRVLSMFCAGFRRRTQVRANEDSQRGTPRVRTDVYCIEYNVHCLTPRKKPGRVEWAFQKHPRSRIFWWVSFFPVFNINRISGSCGLEGGDHRGANVSSAQAI